MFAGSPLDRVSERRKDGAWLAAQLEREESRFLPFWRLNVLVKTEKPELAWATAAIRSHAGRAHGRGPAGRRAAKLRTSRWTCRGSTTR